MQVKSLVIRVLVFAGALTAGIAAAIWFSSSTLPVIEPVPYQTPVKTEPGTGSSYHGSERGTGFSAAESTPLKILAKPRPGYTDVARQNDVQGDVTLRVTFLASGEIGGISVVNSLPDGLNEQAIMAARKIKFEPAIHNGEPINTVKMVQYTFSIY